MYYTYLTTDGKAFVIIIKVIERKFEKQKHASLNQSVLLNIQNCFSKRILIATSWLKKIHTLVSIL